MAEVVLSQAEKRAVHEPGMAIGTVKKSTEIHTELKARWFASGKTGQFPKLRNLLGRLRVAMPSKSKEYVAESFGNWSDWSGNRPDSEKVRKSWFGLIATEKHANFGCRCEHALLKMLENGRACSFDVSCCCANACRPFACLEICSVIILRSY